MNAPHPYLTQRLRTLDEAVLDCYRNAVRLRDWPRAAWIARNFPIRVFARVNVAA